MPSITATPSAPVPVDVAAAREAAARPGTGRGAGNLYVGPGLGASLLGLIAALAQADGASGPG